MKIKSVLGVAVVLGCLSLVASPARATTYTYVGNPYDFGAQAPLPDLGFNMTGSVTFNFDTSATSGDFFFSPGGSITAMQLTSGIYTVSAPNTGFFGEVVLVNGAITQWTISGSLDTTALNQSATVLLASCNPACGAFAPAFDNVLLTLFGSGGDDLCTIPGTCEQLSGAAGGSITPGIWTAEVATTPLPAALPLFATGLGALGLLGWRRKKKQAA